MNPKRITLFAQRSEVEPLGIMYVSAACREAGWLPFIHLVDDWATEVPAFAAEIKPDVIGATAYVGNATAILRAFKAVNGPVRIVGGPYVSANPQACLDSVDFAVTGHAVESMYSILNGFEGGHIVRCEEYKLDLNQWPLPDRAGLYAASPSHAASPIKSMIGSIGCPFACSYCYNSVSKAIYPHRLREPAKIMAELVTLAESPYAPKTIFWQDDVFGGDIEWISKLAAKIEAAKLPFKHHIQTRAELIDPETKLGQHRLFYFCLMGVTGVTMAIESSDKTIREEVLNRRVPDGLFMRVCKALAERGLKLRTEQMLGLPAGATAKKTPVGLDLDLDLLRLNVELRKATDLPTMAWASIFEPYKGTAAYGYCVKHGFHVPANDDKAPADFFHASALRFPKRWVGPSLLPGTLDWMETNELAEYRGQLASLQRLFHVFALIPNGHIVAEKLLRGGVGDLGKITKQHLYESELYV